jgi:thiol-disulfide isomerase/thioredoxin
MKKKIISLLITTSMAIFLAGCDKKHDASSLVSTKNLAKNIELTSIDGKKINMIYTGNGFTFGGAEGKTVLVNFFATWCPPCRAEVPHLVELQEKYKNDFVVVAVLMEENKKNEELAAFIKEFNINYFIANSPANFEASEAFGGIKGIPSMFMFDKNGKQIAHYPGATPQEIIEQDILKSLGKQ